MAKTGMLFAFYVSITAALLLSCHCLDRKVHVIYMGDRHKGETPAAVTHHSLLTYVLGSASLAKESMVFSYGRSFNGFAAKMTKEEAQKILDTEGVVSVMPNTLFELHTTKSWDFTGLPRGNYGGGNQGDVIVGVIDTGIWPESESFRDDGFSPPPAKWKGACTGANFTCNNKLIGARYYNSEGFPIDESDFNSPRDWFGHGTHTASTAAGAEVEGVSYKGLAKGVARGGVPKARIAMYKVCWYYGCALADILAAFDDAIADKVDILSVSLGTRGHNQYFQDALAIGSFHAMKNGILTSMSAGNSGPRPTSVINHAPWALTVAASTIDRKFVAQAVLGNGQTYSGLSVNNFELHGVSFPLIWGGDAANVSAGHNSDIARYCLPGTLNSYKVEGKIVLCDVMDDSSGILLAHGVGAIMADTYTDVSFNYPLPATQISIDAGIEILNYIRSTENPIATILLGETVEDTMAASVASFSSRGPNYIAPDILKPDITAPGVDILAAWSPASSPSSYWYDTQRVKYNVISGTSMSAPHAGGAAAYIKSVNPTWSPAAIKSALMTTAFVMDPMKHSDLEFAYGAGHINPVKAVDPGLVYNASEADYIKFLCKQGYNASALRLVTGDYTSTCNGVTPGKVLDLNYPTFALSVEDGQPIDGFFTRTVTNVGPANSTYTVTGHMPEPIVAIVDPSVLTFSAVGETKTYTLKLSGPKIAQQPIMSGAIIWTDGIHAVRSPIVVYSIIPGGFASANSVAPQKATTFEKSSIYHKNGILSTD